jgi:hypothetical protein
VSFSKVLIAVDEGPVAAHAVHSGVELARAHGAEVALIHIIDPTLNSAPMGPFVRLAVILGLLMLGEALGLLALGWHWFDLGNRDGAASDIHFRDSALFRPLLNFVDP